MKRVLLINMPFASIRYPSPALSLLKSLLVADGVKCDVRYLNIDFQAFAGLPEIYEAVADLMIIGEWVFGEALFGRQWVQSERSRLDALAAPLLPEGPRRRAIYQGIARLRSLAEPFLSQCLTALDLSEYAIVGFTSVYSQQVASLALARRLKERWPDRIIAFGGANCEDPMGQALLRLFPFVDWVFSGAADRSFPLAVRQGLQGLQPEGVEGVSFRRNGRTISQPAGPEPEMDALPYPDFTEYFDALEKWRPEYLPLAPISLELSRGCWWGKKSQCIFCGLNCKTLSYRRKGPRRAEEEIKTLTQRHGVERVILTDSILDPAYFKTLLPALAKWGGLTELFVETRADLNRRQVEILKAAGVCFFQPGIESLDTEILTHMGKGTSLLDNLQLLKWAREFGVYPTWNLLYGFPRENPAAYRRMTRLIPAITHLYPPMDISPVLLVRFSPLLEQSAKWGLQQLRAHRGYQAVYPFEGPDLDDMAYFFEADFAGRAEIPSYVDPLKDQVRLWHGAWAQQEAPRLTLVHSDPRHAIIFDSRPGRSITQVELHDTAAAAYLACDEARTLVEVDNFLRSSPDGSHAGQEQLHRCLADLVDQDLMLRENDRYLSLATGSEPALESAEEW